MVSDGLEVVVGAMVSDVLDQGGRGYGVYGVCWFGPGWSGLWCLWCLMAWTWVVQAMVFMASEVLTARTVGAWSDYGAYGV